MHCFFPKRNAHWSQLYIWCRVFVQNIWPWLKGETVRWPVKPISYIRFLFKSFFSWWKPKCSLLKLSSLDVTLLADSQLKSNFWAMFTTSVAFVKSRKWISNQSCPKIRLKSKFQQLKLQLLLGFSWKKSPFSAMVSVLPPVSRRFPVYCACRSRCSRRSCVAVAELRTQRPRPPWASWRDLRW